MHSIPLHLRRGIPCLLAITILAGCSDDKPTRPRDPNPSQIIAPLEGAVTDVQLIADQPTSVVFSLHLPPEIASITAAEIDIAATLDHVRIDGIKLWQLIARKAARLAGRADEVGATAYFRIGTDAATVCETGALHGPFVIAHDTELSVSPASAEADEATLQIINAGPLIVCMIITANIDATLSVDGLAVNITEGSCASPADFAGAWHGTYECSNPCGDPFGGMIALTVTQNGQQASYTDDGGYTFTGRVCGDTFRFEYLGEDFLERGTLTLTSPSTAVKRSTWRNTFPPYCGGECVDYLTRGEGDGCPPLVITSEPPPDGQVGVPYFFTPTVSGGFGEVTIWTMMAEPIPGFEEYPSSSLYGVPTAEAAGTWQVLVTAYDFCPDGSQTVNESYWITIHE
jgi:hypothetical protein